MCVLSFGKLILWQKYVTQQIASENNRIIHLKNEPTLNQQWIRSKSKHYWNDSCHGDGDSELLNILGMAGEKKWWWDEYKEGKNGVNGNETMQQPEAGLMRPILAGYLCDDDRERKKNKKWAYMRRALQDACM